jgi:hypothetical protein
LIKKWIASIVTQIILGGYIMTIETKMVKRPVKTEGEIFLLWNDSAEKVIEIGDLDIIKETIQNLVEAYPQYDLDLLYLIPHKHLVGVTIDVKNEVKVEMDDDKYNEEEVQFEIYDCENTSRGAVYETEYEDEALEELARLVKDSNGREDRFSLYRKVNYLTTYNIDAEKDVIINIPDQEVEVVVEKEKVYIQSIEEIKSPSILTDAELESEISELWNRMQLFHAEKTKRQEAKKLQEAFEPDDFMM